MLLTKEVEVKPNGKMIQYYKDLGYDSKYGQAIIIKVEDLPENSNAKVEVLCDMCKENTMLVKYSDYNKVMKRTGDYVCRPCSYKKRDQTNLKKYGSISYLGTKECREKTKEVMLEKHGVEYYTQTQEYKEKHHNTCVERYGESYNQLFREKAMNTLYENTGYAHAMQNPVIKNIVKKTNFKRYGVVCTLQSSEVREKVVRAFYENSSVATSKQQRYICDLYNGILNFPVKFYNVDICLPDCKLTIEYDGSGHLKSIFTGQLTQEEFNQKEIVRNSVIKKEGYKQMRIISSRDLLPSNQILLQMLEEAKQYFADYPNHSWIIYDIDNSTIRNAEHKDGVPYNFGELHKINKTIESENVA